MVNLHLWWLPKDKIYIKKIERSFELSMKIEKLTVYEIPFREWQSYNCLSTVINDNATIVSWLSWTTTYQSSFDCHKWQLSIIFPLSLTMTCQSFFVCHECQPFNHLSTIMNDVLSIAYRMPWTLCQSSFDHEWSACQSYFNHHKGQSVSCFLTVLKDNCESSFNHYERSSIVFQLSLKTTCQLKCL